jgi:putative hydrolase of the HAD superfamily
LNNLKTYKHLFFDLDNTLWDFKANAREAFYDIFLNLQLFERIPDLSLFIEVYEKHNEHLWTEYRKGKVKKDHMRIERIALTFRELGIDDPELTGLVGDLYVQGAPRKTNLFPFVHETLQYLSGRYKLYILTNGFAEIQVQKINNCGLQGYFSKLFMAEMVGYQKPDRRFFEYAIKSVHAHKNECLMIGDDPDADVRGGWNAGIDQVFYNTGNKECTIKPTWEIDSIASLMKIL